MTIIRKCFKTGMKQNQIVSFNFRINGKLRRKRAYGWNHHTDDYGPERGQCKARYQQSPVEVFARFLAVDQVGDFYFHISTFPNSFINIFKRTLAA